MTTVEAQDTLKRAIAALKAGNRSEARRLLDGLLAADRHNEQAWLWMSGVVDNDAERVICLENVLTLNPYNDRARQGLEKLGHLPPPLPIAPLLPAEPAAYVPPARDPFPQAASPRTRGLIAGSEAAAPGIAPPRPEVADYRLYITLVIVLSFMLVCTVVGIVAAVLFFAPGT